MFLDLGRFSKHDFYCLAAAGATTVAVLPICTTQPPAESGALIPENNQAIAAPQQQQQQSILALPFPLELVALCMLRVLQRQSHEGGLDANTKSAMSECMYTCGHCVLGIRHRARQTNSHSTCRLAHPDL